MQSQSQLTFLDLAGASIGNDGLANIVEGIKYSISLRVLNLSFNTITSQGSKFVAEVMGKSTIKKLDLSQNPLGDTFKTELNLSTKYRFFLQSYLNFSKCNFLGQGTAIFFEALKKDACLSTLILDECKIDKGEYEAFSLYFHNNSSIKSFSLKNSNLGDTGVEELGIGISENNCLKELYLAGNLITVYI